MTHDSKLYASEAANPASLNAHDSSIGENLRAINAEDARLAAAVERAIPAIEILVAETLKRMRQGGRLFYIGAGTSGRLGVLDASEMPPTYGVDPGLVNGIIAGGGGALRNSIEGAEDSAEQGAAAVAEMRKNDVLVCLSASGSAQFVQSAARAARENDIYTACISTAPDSPLLPLVDCPILAETGPEFVAGSTRMKSGTAQKLILNMISTSLMIALGHVYAGRMINVKTSNEKLRQRAVKMVATLSGCTPDTAERLVNDLRGVTSTPVTYAVIMALENCDHAQAARILAEQNGRIDTTMRKHGRDKLLGCLLKTPQDA